MSGEKAKKKATKKPAKKTTKKSTKDSTKKTSAKKATKSKVEAVVKEGSLVYVDYVGKTRADGKVFDLTLEDVAKKEGLFREDDRYEPILVAVGSNWLLEAIEEELVGMKVEETKTIDVPPERGAGKRDPSLVKMIAKAKLEKQGVRIAIGEKITFGREQGVITQVLGRTARVDFNPPMAGKTLRFDVTVKGIVSEPDEKVFAVLRRRIPAIPKEKYGVSIKGKTVTVDFPMESRYIEGIQYAEIGVAMDTLKVIPDSEKVKIVVTYERPEKPAET
ncbi:MAG: FKBP-type peptidyl-prolyl cis-trans isomerase [Promethearchaeota archaeon]